MSLLVWNYWGLGNQHTEDQLADLVWVKDLSVVFIAKTWTNKARLGKVQRRIEFKNKFKVLQKNKAGGLVMCWKEYFDLTIETFSWNHIDTTINKNKKDEWRFIGFYGETDTQKRHELWAHLHSLKNRGNAPWLYAGDSNEITRQSEKCGGRVGPHSQMHPFWDILDECGFMDMGFVGS